MSVACTDVLHLWSLIRPLAAPSLPINLYCDNQGAQCIAETGTNSTRSKWFDTRVHFLQDWHNTKAIKYHYIHTSLNVADALTKSLGEHKLTAFRPQMLGITPVVKTRPAC